MKDCRQAFWQKAQEQGFTEMSAGERYRFLSDFVMDHMGAAIRQARRRAEEEKTAYYLSAEFLLGRLIGESLHNLGLDIPLRDAAKEMGVDIGDFSDIPDHALGNGGLGRLAACFLEAAATSDIPLWGYGIRYRYGLFTQRIQNGAQTEMPDDWQRMGDPWSIRREEEAVTVMLGRRRIRAIPYDTPIFGYGTDARVGICRLWQAESEEALDLALFEAGRYGAAVARRERAERISAVLYPSDRTPAGQELRLSQELFFTEASVADILRRFERAHGQVWDMLPEYAVLQLNDTHPALAIPALIGGLEERGVPFQRAAAITSRMVAYTNHTVMAEALEEWEEGLLRRLSPRAYRITKRLDAQLRKEAERRAVDAAPLSIVADGRIRMANLAAYVSFSVNGVAPLHTQILRERVLHAWHMWDGEKLQNKTNGISIRRWLGVANPALSAFITERIGEGWMTDAARLTEMASYAEDAASRAEFFRIRDANKRRLLEKLQVRGLVVPECEMLFDIQIKRIHEYKRQLMNAFAILGQYFDLKDGHDTELPPTAFLIGGKSAPGYARAKGIIRYILAIADRINQDPAVRDRMRVIFVEDYNVSWAETLIPAGDLSEQISMAGTEASGTGNMKFMLNGVPTLGSYDGANLEIFREAGEMWNFPFGGDAAATAEALSRHDPVAMLHQDPRLRRIVSTLIDGTFDDGGSGIFGELYASLTEGASWHRPDHYFVLGDFAAYDAARRRAMLAYRDRERYGEMCLRNLAAAGVFSADRAVREYDREIWRK